MKNILTEEVNDGKILLTYHWACQCEGHSSYIVFGGMNTDDLGDTMRRKEDSMASPHSGLLGI